jgi:hypothetical protein
VQTLILAERTRTLDSDVINCFPVEALLISLNPSTSTNCAPTLAHISTQFGSPNLHTAMTMLLPRPALRTLLRTPFRSTYATAAAATAPLKQTPLHSLHVHKGAKLVPFGGYSMPITYASQSITESHHQVRRQSGLFDVSHMVQHQ